MHEFKIAQNVLKIVLKEAEKKNLSKISTIRVEIGNLNNLTEDALQFGFDHISTGTIAENAKIEMKEIEGTIISIKDFDGE